MLYIELIILIAFSIPAAVIDCKTLKIPNQISFVFMGIGLSWGIVTRFNLFWQDLIAFFIIFILGYFRIMGLGDIKMLMAIALLSGWIVALLSFVFGCIVFLVFNLIFKPKVLFSSDKYKQKQPFYIHIFIGSIISYIFLYNFLLKEVFI